jgi:hypothetical protein
VRNTLRLVQLVVVCVKSVSTKCMDVCASIEEGVATKSPCRKSGNPHELWHSREQHVVLYDSIY